MKINILAFILCFLVVVIILTQEHSILNQFLIVMNSFLAGANFMIILIEVFKIQTRRCSKNENE